MAVLFGVLLIIGMFFFLWYVICAEAYIEWLKQTLEANNIEVEKDRYDRS